MQTGTISNKITNNIRRNIIEMVYAANSGHIGGSLSAVEIMTALYFSKMNISCENYLNDERDRFVLSKGHASPVLYAVLIEKGICKEDVKTFRRLGSKLQGHPNMNYVPGVEMSTGSLGQGVSTAVGMALGFKIDNKPNQVFALIGDGELEEGQVWEAAMAAGHFKLNNLTIIVDNNNLQIDGKLDEVMSPYPIIDKFKAFNFDVYEVDGHNLEQLIEAFHVKSDKPKCIVAKTIKGKGISFMENNPNWHGTAPNSEQYIQAMEELGGSNG